VGGTVSGESASLSERTTEEWLKNVFAEIRKNYRDEQIFNADERGLFFKMTPNKTLKFKGEKCCGGKMSKDRITVLVVANMTGTVKKKLLVIGKSKNPRCFKNVKRLITNPTDVPGWCPKYLKSFYEIGIKSYVRQKRKFYCWWIIVALIPMFSI
jgi:hypothetical protein